MTTKLLNYERPIIQKLNSGTLNKFGLRTEFSPVTELEGNSVKKIINDYGSPVFVFSERKIRKNINNANRAFKTRYPKVQFAWSYKTNYNNAICKIFHQEGSWAEVVSGFEYQKALNNKVPGNKIIFNGPDKNVEDLLMALKNESFIHIDHFDELYKLEEILKSNKLKAKVAIRVNMDTGIYPMWDRFGFNYESNQAWTAISKINSIEEMDLVGLHCHIGTYMLSTSAYAVAAEKLCTLMQKAKEFYSINLKYLDLGGGFASANTLKGSYLDGADYIPSIDDYAETICNTILNFGFKQKELPLLILETGRALIDDTAWLCGTVLANKRLSDGRKATIIDVGVNILFTSFWYNHKVSPAQSFSHFTEDTVLYGPLCMNIDCIRESITLPILNKDDNFVIHSVGAYNTTQWMQFITYRPKILLIDTNGKIHVIRNNENSESMNQNEIIPKHLIDNKL